MPWYQKFAYLKSPFPRHRTDRPSGPEVVCSQSLPSRDHEGAVITGSRILGLSPAFKAQFPTRVACEQSRARKGAVEATAGLLGGGCAVKQRIQSSPYPFRCPSIRARFRNQASIFRNALPR